MNLLNLAKTRPDTQYIKSFYLTKEEHKVTFKVINSDLKETKVLNFNNDKCIFLSYSFKKPADSLKKIELDKLYGSLFNNDSTILSFYKGKKPRLNFHVMENIKGSELMLE